MQRVAVLNVVGLTESMLGENTPALTAFAKATGGPTSLRTPIPAVTTTVQTSMLTGAPVSEHGIVGNGWYDRKEAEVKFWKQSNRLLDCEPIWDTARRRDPVFTCANVCWWYAMNANVETIVTPRPIYRANGRKVPDCWTRPGELREELTAQLGRFPLFQFWGPGASIESTRWIASAAIAVEKDAQPTLQLVYLPHLDYPLQQLGPDDPRMHEHLRALDNEVARLLGHFEKQGVRVVVVSEYGMSSVTDAVAINRELRNAGLLTFRDELGREMLQPTECRAFAVADHQIAHVYLSDMDASERAEVANRLRAVDGIDRVLGADEMDSIGLRHERSGDLLAISDKDRWFSYDWWLDEARAPDYARTVDIHRKPGYDPRELFSTSSARAAWKVLLMKLGVRTLLDIVPLDTKIVRGSHGRNDPAVGHGPVLIGVGPPNSGDSLPCESVRDLLLELIFA